MPRRSCGMKRIGEVQRPVSVEDVVRHIRHMIQVGGMECVGLGSDLDGCKISFEIESAADMPLLINCLEKNGFTASRSIRSALKMCCGCIRKFYRRQSLKDSKDLKGGRKGICVPKERYRME